MPGVVKTMFLRGYDPCPGVALIPKWTIIKGGLEALAGVGGLLLYPPLEMSRTEQEV